MPVELEAGAEQEAWGLESIREAKGISLEEIATETRLKVATLRAIETADFRALPGGIYSVSYIRQYARAIGVDETNLVSFYRKQCSSGTPREEEETCQRVRQLLQTRPPLRAL